jgi:hypothetical protein
MTVNRCDGAPLVWQRKMIGKLSGQGEIVLAIIENFVEELNKRSNIIGTCKTVD